MVSEAEVWRTKSITAPSRPPESFTNCATSAVRSVNPPPGVWTVSSEVATVSALTADSAVRDSELGEVVLSLEVIFLRLPSPAYGATRQQVERCRLKSCRRYPSAIDLPSRPAGAKPAPETTSHDPCRGRSAEESQFCVRSRLPSVQPSSASRSCRLQSAHGPPVPP